MKKSATFIFAAMMFTSLSKGQDLKESEIPEKVKMSFEKKYPGIKAKWEKEGIDYEAEFLMDKMESSAVFAADGMFKELEQEMPVTDLPKIITEYCSKKYPAYKLAEASKITRADGKVEYEAELRKGREHVDLMFDDNGNFISKGNAENDADD